jgi:hypothetical protein
MPWRLFFLPAILPGLQLTAEAIKISQSDVSSSSNNNNNALW